MTVWQESTEQNIWIVGVRGRLAQDLTPKLEACLLQLLTEGHYRLAVNLTETSYINSGGLRALVTAWRKARQQGGNLVIYGLNAHLQEVFEMVGFDKVFQIYPSRKEALSTYDT